MATTTEEHQTVIIGGGQAGLALSRLLSDQNREHVVLEASDELGHRWRSRWDSFHLVTPNWQLQLPGHEYDGDDPDGFLHRDEVVAHLEDYAASFDPPVRFGIRATRVARAEDGTRLHVETTDGAYEADNVVVATGTFQSPRVPAASARLPGHVHQLHSQEYRSPGELPDGGVLVVGAGQSGSQIARELHDSGRQVQLCVGSGGRLPRTYRGRDGMWWGVKLGMTDQTVDDLDHPGERFEANPRISGQNGGTDVNLHEYARAGIGLLGRLEDVRDGRALLADNLHEELAAADEMATKVRAGVDKYIAAEGLDLPDEDVEEPRDGYDVEPPTSLDLSDAGVETVLWATGYRWDYSWVRLPVFDAYGYPVQERGVTEEQGLYFLGLHFLHQLKSGLFLGVGDDARHVAQHIAGRRGW